MSVHQQVLTRSSHTHAHTRTHTYTHVHTRTHTFLYADAAPNALKLQQRRWVQILEAHGRSDLKSLVEGVESVGELVDKTELVDASDGLKDQLMDMGHDAGA